MLRLTLLLNDAAEGLKVWNGKIPHESIMFAHAARKDKGSQLATDVVALSLYAYDLRLWRGMTACNYFMALNFDKRALEAEA